MINRQNIRDTRLLSLFKNNDNKSKKITCTKYFVHLTFYMNSLILQSLPEHLVQE